ncbi:unnamed protein product [Rotaria sp. Silwood2]|nr:unnamed protein product [Rotaria sp. Silwood2]CAF3094823.1 unnamed protein product [Rotaria sp. Silwood2]CAF3326631.1 unnamed protein product [Rotaria sp. Silwood2]CAF3430036.1 unnamed protein product [Rotaria sp. Silwood2]CAF4070330.1 unnamed protein product [Rotaria sp. Silwood2]
MSADSTSEEFITFLRLIQTNLFRYGGSILIGLGSLSCILSVIVFTRKTLRKNPCSTYFIALYVVNFLYIHMSLLPLTLEIGYNIDVNSYNLFYCRFSLYVAVVLNTLNAYYIILASIDRILVTSPKALTRKKSSHFFAYKLIIGGTLFWMLFLSHILVFTALIPVGPNTFLCYFQSGWYLMFISYYSLVKETVAPFLMIIFGVWSVKNIRRVHRVKAATVLTVNENTEGGGSYSNFSRDRQLVFLLVKDVIIYILFTFIMAVSLIYDQMTQYLIKNAEEIQKGIFLRYVAIFSVNIPFCIGCYTNLLISKTFRREVKNIFSWQ